MRGIGVSSPVASVAVKKMRLDVALVDQGLSPSRERARSLILAGRVARGRPGRLEGRRTGHRRRALEIAQPDHPYVGRGGVKLAHALDTFAIDPTGRRALDIGASTGGFTDVLLRRGAASVIALDVGHGQLDWRLRTDPRVIVREGVNARALTSADVPHRGGPGDDRRRVHLAPAHLPGAAAVSRAGRRRRGAGETAVRSRPRRGRQARPRHRSAVHEAVIARGDGGRGTERGLRRLAMTPSAITGATGNQEFFLHLRLASR